MRVRVSYLKRNKASGRVELDGFELSQDFEVDRLPRIGEHVLVPQPMLDKLPPGLFRLEVVQIDHEWHSIMCPDVRIYLSDAWWSSE